MIASAVVLMQDEVAKENCDSWADSESDFELSNFDPEVGPGSSEAWKCLGCRTSNVPFIRYCSKCWQVRIWESQV